LLSYAEGYLNGSNYDDTEKHTEGFGEGKKYSIEFGKILGKIEYNKVK
jgi:hypothetical protein